MIFDTQIEAALDAWHPHWRQWSDLDQRRARKNMLAAIVAAGAPMPISEAPMDGTVIHAWNGAWEHMQYSTGPEWSGWLYADTLLSDADPDPLQPTFFLPMPPDPIGDEA